MAKKAMKRGILCDGQVRFERGLDGSLAVRQGWNPGSLDCEDRDTIVKELREIADHIENDEFENDQEYKFFPASQ